VQLLIEWWPGRLLPSLLLWIVDFSHAFLPFILSCSLTFPPDNQACRGYREMDFFLEEFYTVYRMWKTNKRSLFQQFVALGLVVTSALMVWKSLIVYTNSESPIVVILSGSMEPSFK